MKYPVVVLLVAMLAGCGVETASTAAVVGAAKSQEAEQAQASKERVQQQLDAAAAQAAARLQAADEAAR